MPTETNGETPCEPHVLSPRRSPPSPPSPRFAMPAFADALLSGTIKSSDGEKMGGVTVSAKPDGGTITTTVFTDEAGNYYFPPLPAGKYRVWAQALSYQTAKGEVDLAANRKHDFTLAPMKDAEATFKQLPGNLVLAALPEETPGRPAHEAHRAHRLHRLPHRELPVAAPLRRGRLERHHRADEERQRLRHLCRRRPQAVRHSRLPPEGARGLSRASARPRRKRHEGQARAAAVGRSGARRVQGIRRAARSRCRPAGQLRAERRQRLVARHALGSDPGLGRA